MSNDKVQRQENLADLIDAEENLNMCAKLRGWMEIYRKLGKTLDNNKIKEKYIEKHLEIDDRDLLHNLKVIDDVVDLINNKN